MLFHGKKLDALAIGEVCVPRPDGQSDLFFKVRAIAHGDEKKGTRMFPDPSPPDTFKKDAKGKALRDPITNRVITEKDYDNAAYISESEKAERHQMAVMFVDCLDQDPNVTWETEAEHGSKQFYVDCTKEIAACGLSVGDINIVLQKAMELGNIDANALKRSAEAFSRREAPEA